MPTTKESMIEVINVALNNQRELANKDAEWSSPLKNVPPSRH